MSLAELQRLALINAELVQKGKPLQSYGLPSGQASEYAGLEGLFSSAQSAGSSSFFHDTIGGAVSGLTSLIKTGTEAGNYVGKQIGLPNLGSNLYTFLTPGSFLPDVLSRATTGKTLAEQLSSLGQNIAKDTSSTAYQVGNILGQAGTAILGTGAVSAGLKGLGIGAKAINAAGFTTTAADIGAGTAIGGALQAAGDWEQFDKSNGQPGAKMSGAEFLTRMGMGMITGGLSAPLNPRWGKLANIGFDAIVGGATQGALEGAGYLAANKARQEEIEKTYKSNIATSAAINAAIGAGARGVQALLTPKPAAAEPVAPAAPATPATPVAPVVAPPAAAQIHPYDQLEKNLGQWAQQLSPEQLVDHAQRWGVDNPTPQDLTAKIMSDVRNTDASGQNVEGTLEWVDQMIGENWHPKGTGQVLPVQPVAGAEQPQVSAEEAAERAAIAEAGQQAPEQSAPANIQPSPGGYVYDLPGTARQVAQTMTLLERSNFADRVGLRSVTTEAITQALSDPFVLTEHLLGKSPDLAKSLAQAMKLQDASPAAVVNAMRGGIDTSGKTPQEIYQRLGTMIERLASTPPTPEPVPSPIQGEPNVQPRPEDVNVSEPGQPEPIAGEPPVQAVEPSEVQQAEAIPPTGAEGQAPEVSAAGQVPEDLGVLDKSIFPYVKGGLLTKIDQWSADNTDYTLGVRPENNPIAKAVESNRASLLPVISDMLTDVIAKYKLPQGAVDYLGEKGIFSNNSSPFVEASEGSYPYHYEESSHLVSYLHTPVDIDPKKLKKRQLKALGGEEGVSRLNQALREVRDRVLVELQSDKYSTITIPDPSERRIILSPEQKKFKKREYKAQSVMDKIDDIEVHRLQQYINNILPWAESAYGLNDNTMKLLRDAGPLAIAADYSPENVSKFIRFLASDDEDGIRLAYKNRDEILLADPNANSLAWLGGEQAVDRLRRAFQDIQTDLRMWMGLSEGSSVSKPSQGQASAEATTPITEPIAGEPYATQEGQVTEGGQPEYLGVPQGEGIRENGQEVRQEEGGRPGDSGGLVESGQEQGSVATVSQEIPGSSEGDAAVMDVASEGLLNQLGDEAGTIDPESLVGQYVQDGKITDFPNATNDQIATAENVIKSNLDGRKIQDAAAAIIDQEGVLSSESPQMAETMQKFLRGDGSGSHAIQMSVAGKENPLRRLIDILTEYTGVDVPDTRTMRREAEASEDRMSTYVFEKDGIPIATMAYYKEPGRKRAVMMLDPSPEFLAAVDLHRSEMLSQAMGEAYGEISPEIGEMFASTEAGVTPTQASELDVQNVQTMTKKRQMPYRESLEAQSKMRELYDETVQMSSETYGVEPDTFYNAVDALSTAEQEVGATGDLFSSDAWQSYVDQLELESDKEVADDRAFRQDVREALAFKKQIEIAQSAVKEAPAPKRRRRLQRGQEGFDFSEGAAKASLGILPAVAAPTLEDDKEYFPGVNGATIKGLLLTVGAGAFMMHHISKKPVMHVGGDITGMTNERTTWLQSLRNRITGADSKRLMVAQITNDARKYGSIFGLSEDSINELIAKNLKDHTELEKIPSIPGMRGITALDILGRQVDSDLPGRLSDAAYAGRAVGEKRSIPINLAQKAFKSLPDDRQVALAKLMIDIDYATTARLNAEQAMVTSNLWTKQSKSLQDACAQEVQSILQKAQQANPDGWAQLSADYKMLDPIYDDARRAYFEMVAYEQTGVESIDAGFAQYNKKIDKLNVLLRNAVSDATKAREKKLSLEEIKAKNAAIEGINNQLAMAHKMRNVLGDLRNAREMSVARKYIPRWFDVEHHQHRIRIKETATDVGLMRSFANEADMANELERLNRPLTDEDRTYNKIPEEHPVTGAKLNTWADYYRSQGGSVEVVRNRFNQTSLIQHTANQMALREALDALHDSVADGGSITADRFKQFLDTYGGDISNMVTGKELDDIGVSARKIDELVGTNSRVSTAQIRRLVNAIAVPQMVDNTMHRSNVLGYAPEPVIPGTNAVNKDYNKQMMDFIDNGFNFFLSRTKSKAESASLRREINTQIIDLTSRGIAPKYVSMLGDISSGLRWKPSVLTKSTGEQLFATKADTTIAAFGAFKMMGGNVPSAVKNVFMGFVNTATQLPAETDGNLFKAVSLGVRGEAAYWRMLAKDRVMRKEMASYLRTPDTLQSVDEQIAKALSENDALRAVWTLAREADSFGATFYKSLERVLNPETITGSQSFKKLVEFGATPQVLAEHHNRGAAFMTGALAHLEQFPTDINGAFSQGLKFQGMTQGNFNNYNKSITERKLLEVPISRSFLLLSNAALRSNEQLGAHFVAAAMRPTHAAVWAPLLAFAGTSMVFTGLIGAPIAGDVYKTINFFADLFEKDDGELNAIKESPLEALERKAGDVAESMGFGRDLGEYVFKNMAIGTSSVITGKNFSTENSVMNMVSQFPPPGLSIIPAAFDYGTKFADMSDKERLLRGSTLLNVEVGRAVRAIAQGIEGGKYDKSGNVVSPMYTWQQGAGDVLFGSDLDEAMYGTSKRGGGGKIYYADQANKYMNTISSISGLKLDDIHLRPFYQKTPGLPDEQANVEAANKFRALNIANYNSLKDQERQTLDIWNGITSDPEKRKILIRIAMEGQTGSRLSNETEEFLSGAERKIKSYYLALAVQQSYVQAGIPPPEFKYQAADPMVPVWKYIASKVKRGQLQLAPGD